MSTQDEVRAELERQMARAAERCIGPQSAWAARERVRSSVQDMLNQAGQGGLASVDDPANGGRYSVTITYPRR